MLSLFVNEISYITEIKTTLNFRTTDVRITDECGGYSKLWNLFIFPRKAKKFCGVSFFLLKTVGP